MILSNNILFLKKSNFNCSGNISKGSNSLTQVKMISWTEKTPESRRSKLNELILYR